MAASREAISSMPLADMRNECEAYGLPTTGNKNELVQRLLSLRRSRRLPPLATSFSIDEASSSVNRNEKGNNTLERTDEREREIDEMIARHFEKLNKHLMLFVGANSQNGEETFEDNGVHESQEESLSRIIKLNRKLKMLETNIELMFEEIERVEKVPCALIEMKDLLLHLNTLENDFCTTFQEILSLIQNEDTVDQEIKRWSNIQREILIFSRKANNYIDSISKKEEKLTVKLPDVDTHKNCSGMNHLRLPKLTLSDFSGEILEWIPWRDQFRSCIHENSSLGNRERFNYLLMYLKGSAKRCIEYIEVTSENYTKAIEILKSRYGRTRIVVEHLLDSILKIEKKERVNAQSMCYLYDAMVNRYHTLESYEPNLKYCHRIMVPILQSKLPQDVRKKWEFELSKLENEEDDKRVTVEYFFRFLRSHVMSEEASEAAGETPKTRATDERKINYHRSERSASSSAIALNTSSRKEVNSPKNDCPFCEKQHEPSKCYTIQRKSVEERVQIVKDKRLCFNCLLPTGPKHVSATCKKPGCFIEGCKGKHHVLLHRVLTAAGETAHTGLQTSTVMVNKRSPTQLLPTALAKLHANCKEVSVRVLVDSGSDHMYIRAEVALALGLETSAPSTLMTIFMHGGQKRTERSKNVKFQVSNHTSSTRRIKLSAWSVSTVCAPLDPVQLDISCYKHLKGLSLADEFPRSSSTIDVLIGADQWGQVMLNGVRKGPASTPFAVNSIFGWLLSGSVDETSPKETQQKSISNCAVVKIEEDVYKEVNGNLKRFWELKSIGITDGHELKEMSAEERDALNQFHTKIKYDGERYEVGLPWRSGSTKLQANYDQALRRMVKIEEALHKDKNKEKMYKEAMQKYFDDGHARQINNSDAAQQPVFYLPHHPVIREDKTTTKCRVVFDASARNKDGISLNDCLLPGPALQPNLVSILLRFRLNKIAMMSDIKKMFLQIKLAESDQNCHRFLWRENPNERPRVYCMTRVTFGVISSPFQAIATVQHHCSINKDRYPCASKEVQENMYVDDLLTGADDVDKAYALHKDLCSLMKEGGFELVKWYTNSKDLNELIEPCSATNV